MTWFKVDDGFWSHPKTLTLSAEAVALWVRAGSYCGKHLTDGFVSRQILPMLQGTPDHARELVAADLWLDHVDGWQFYAWTEYQDTKTAVETRREAWKTRKRKQREDDTSSNNHSIPKGRVTPSGSPTVSPSGTPPVTSDPDLVAETINQIRATLKRHA